VGNSRIGRGAPLTATSGTIAPEAMTQHGTGYLSALAPCSHFVATVGAPMTCNATTYQSRGNAKQTAYRYAYRTLTWCVAAATALEAQHAKCRVDLCSHSPLSNSFCNRCARNRPELFLPTTDLHKSGSHSGTSRRSAPSDYRAYSSKLLAVRAGTTRTARRPHNLRVVRLINTRRLTGHVHVVNDLSNSSVAFGASAILTGALPVSHNRILPL
jgi:hypothetical protein